LRTIVVVPVKALNRAKSRLDELLSLDERRGLMLAMLRDVTECIQKVAKQDYLCIVSNDPDVEEEAERNGFVYRKDDQQGLNISIESVTVWAMDQQFERMLVIPSDVPLITESDVKLLLENKIGPLVVLTPSRDGGTNALSREPCNIIKPSYGVDSFKKHINLAIKAECKYEVYRSPTLELDIDTPRDLNEFISLGTSNNTTQYVRKNRLLKRQDK
jgi:2-phospho-L-lactate guanylyltransferase